MKNNTAFKVRSLIISFVVIAICETFFLMDVAADFFYLDIGAPWIDHNDLELVSTITLAFALIAIGVQIKQLLQEHRNNQASVQVASGELLAVIGLKFRDWKLTPSEREIALLLIKGLSIHEISEIRKSSLGTVKSQCSGLYQKAGVKGRNELSAYFVEDLLAGDILLPD